MTNESPSQPGARRPRARRILLFLGVAVVAVAAGAALLDASDEGPAPMPATEAAPRTVTTEIAALRRLDVIVPVTGTLVARDEIAIGTAVDGQRIAEVLVEEGDRVAAGQVLLRLETDILEAQRRDAEGRVARARSAAAQQEAMLSDAEAKARRAEQLVAANAMSREELGGRRTAFLAAQHALSAAEAELAQAEAQLVEAQSRLERAVIRAPAGGIVSERLARIGAMAGSEPLVRLIRGGEVELEAEVPEADLPRIAAGQTVRVLTAGLDRTVDGHVRLVAPKVDRQTRLGVARIALPPGPDLRPGIFARGLVLVGEREVLTVGEGVVTHGTHDGGAAVFVVGADDRAVRRAVQTGARQDGRVEIRSGLAAGDRVVAAAGAFIRDGERVAPLPPGAAEARR